jgi:4-amino-4-deoxy-L-arabinose transferase-like glycosyltransferase
VTLPIAFAMRFFGENLQTARSVMAFFLIAFVLLEFTYARGWRMPWIAAGSLWLIVTFPPLYADGKDVLGEIPGLFYTLVFLLLARRIDLQKSPWPYFLAAGLALGLAVATKPIFILLLAPAGIAFLSYGKRLTVRSAIAAIMGTVIPLIVWAWVQFGNGGLGQALREYVNPYSADVVTAVQHNTLLFVTHPEPFYALLMLCVWLASIVIRLYGKQRIHRFP